MPAYHIPQLIQHKQVLGRAHLGNYLDNDRYFHGLGDRLRPIPTGVYNASCVGTETQAYVWSGYHLLREDSLDFYYNHSLSGATGATLKMYYNTVPGDEDSTTLIDAATCQITSNGQDKSASGYYRLSDYTRPGIYGVVFKLDRNNCADGGNAVATATVYPPYSTYRGAIYYVAGPQLINGLDSTVGQFAAWRNNDIYFNAMRPPQAPFLCTADSWSYTTGGTQTIWAGFLPGLGVDTTLYYYLAVTSASPTNSDDNSIYVALDGTKISATEVKPVSTDSDSRESSVSIGVTDKETWHRYEVVMKRTGTETDNASGTVYYLWLGPTNPNAEFRDMGDLDVGQYMFAEPNYRITSPMQYLTRNDRSIVGRLDRRDWAVKSHLSTKGNSYKFQRVYDWLYYRGTSLKMSWGNGSMNLEDVTDGYGSQDLVNVKGLHYGMTYTIEGTLDFALEA